MSVSLTKTDEPIEMSFVMLTQVGLRNHVLSGERVQIPEGKGTWVAPTCVAAMRPFVKIL